MNLATTDLFKNLTNSNKNQNLIILNDDQLKQLQEKVLSIAKDVINICEENNFSYHLTGGSALGAIRHKGFIPWDDDMDIDILRDDYDKLLKLIKEKYPEKYYIHNPYNKDGYSTVATNIRLKNTILRGCNDVKTEQCGVSLDLVVIENTYNNKLLRKIHGLGSLALGLICSCRKFAKNAKYYLNLAKDNPEVLKVFKTKIFIGKCFSFLSLRRWNIFYDKWNSSCKNKNSKLVTVPTGRKHFFGEMYQRKDFVDFTRANFEGFDWKIPKEIEKYLKHMYGNYMELPPIEKREKHVLLEFKL